MLEENREFGKNIEGNLENAKMSHFGGPSRPLKEGASEGVDSFDQEFANFNGCVDVELGGGDLFGQSGQLFGLEEAEFISTR